MTKKFRIEKEFYARYRIFIIGFFVDKKTVFVFETFQQAAEFGQKHGWKLVG